MVTSIDSSRPSKPSTRSVLTRISSPSSSASPLSGSSARASSGRDAPSTWSPCLTTTPTSAMSSSSLANELAVSTAVTIRPIGARVLVDDRVARGRDAGLVAVLELPLPVELQQHAAGARLARRVVQARLDPFRILVGDRLAQLLVGHDLAPGGVGAARGLPVEVRRDPLSLGQLRVGLALLRARDDLEQDRRHGDHRDHHDDHEEQPQPIAEGRREEVAKAHASGGATGNLAAEAVRQSQAPRLQSAFHGAPVKSCRRPCGAIAQLGERLDRTQEVGGSSPPSSIARNSRPLRGFRAFCCPGLGPPQAVLGN